MPSASRFATTVLFLPAHRPTLSAPRTTAVQGVPFATTARSYRPAGSSIPATTSPGLKFLIAFAPFTQTATSSPGIPCTTFRVVVPAADAVPAPNRDSAIALTSARPITRFLIVASLAALGRAVPASRRSFGYDREVDRGPGRAA